MRLQFRSCCVVKKICWVCNSRLLNLVFKNPCVVKARSLSPGQRLCHFFQFLLNFLFASPWKKKKNNNLQSCFFQKWIYRGYTLLVFSNAKLQGKIPWLWMSLESFRGIYTTMSDVWVAAYFITSHTVHTVKINRFPRKMLNRYEKVESSSVTLIHIWFLGSLDVLLLFLLLIRTR